MRFLALAGRWIGFRTGLVFVLLQIACGPALTQAITVSPVELTNYEHVRVRGEHLSPPAFSGRVIRADRWGQAIFQINGAERTVDLLRAGQIQVLTGRQRLKGARIGAGVSMAVAGIGYYILKDTDDFTSLFPQLERVFRSLEASLVGAAFGAGIGAAIGYPRWESVTLILEPQAGAATQPQRIGVAITAKWIP